MAHDDRYLTILIVPHSGRPTRAVRVPVWLPRLAAFVAAGTACFLAASVWGLGVQARSLAEAEKRVFHLEQNAQRQQARLALVSQEARRLQAETEEVRNRLAQLSDLEGRVRARIGLAGAPPGPAGAGRRDGEGSLQGMVAQGTGPAGQEGGPAHGGMLAAEDFLGVAGLPGLAGGAPGGSSRHLGGLTAEATLAAIPAGDVLDRLERTRRSLRALNEHIPLTQDRLEDLMVEIEAYQQRMEAIPDHKPVDGVYVSGFGQRRDPFGGGWEFHPGLDLAAPYGSPVTAAASGRVTEAGYLADYGRAVAIDHGNGLSTVYGHNSSIVVHVGQWVKKGQVIARVGSTGRSTGPHLHFEVRRNGRPVDPRPYLDRGGESLAASR